MVKIRLQRYGNKGRPFYRVVVAKSSAGRNGAFVEILGTYDPVKPGKPLNLKNERALDWLMQGAVPTETAAYLLKRAGILDDFFAQRPKQKANYKFLDKRVAATVSSVIEAPAIEETAPVAVAEEPAAETAEEATAE